MMSHQPPNQSYATPFQINLHQMPSTNYSHMDPQQPGAYPHFSHQIHAPVGNSTLQHTNAFYHNSTVPALNFQGGGRMAQNQVWPQFQNNVPVFPPIPPPPTTNSNFQPPLPNAFSNIVPPPLYPSNGSLDPPHPAMQSSLHSKKRRKTMSDREDGEVSDGGPVRSFSHHRLGNQRQNKSRSPARENFSHRVRNQQQDSQRTTAPGRNIDKQSSQNTSQRRRLRRDNARDHGQVNSQRRSSPSAASRQYLAGRSQRGGYDRWRPNDHDTNTNTRRASPPSASSDESNLLPITKLASPNKPAPYRQQNNATSNSRPSPVHTGASPVSNHVNTPHDFAQQRERAKQFILYMNENGYGYSQLVQQGLDPGPLQGLYDELEIPTFSSALPNKSSRLEPKKLVSKPVPDTISESQTVTESSAMKISQLPSPNKSTTGAPQIRAIKTPQQLRIGATDVVWPVPTNPSQHQVANSQGVTLERKDVIAQLMAAKTRKSATINPTQPTSLPEKPDLGPKSEQEITNQSKANQLPLHDVTKAQGTAQAKKRAQTQLARLRMEALESSRRLAMAKVGTTQDLPETGKTAASPDIPLTDGKPSPNADDQQTSMNQIAGLRRTPPSSRTPLSGIPGLSMTSPWAEPNVPELSNVQNNGESDGGVSLSSSSNELVRARKRPVASDFDEPLTPWAKRPFGQDRYDDDSEDVIIEVSDDDSVDGVDGETQSSNKIRWQELGSDAKRFAGSARPAALRDLPPLSDVASRPNLWSSSNVTGSAPGTPGSLRDIERLKRQEEEIQAMKRKIAEAEQKRKAKVLSSQVETPTKHEKQPESTSGEDDDAHQSDDGNVKKPAPQVQSVGILSTPINLDANSSTPPILKGGQLIPKGSLQSANDWKKRRRAQIQSGLPALEASFTTNTSRLAQLQQQMKELEEAMRQEAENKQQIVRELESLGIDTEGMEHAELQAAKDEVEAQAEAESVVAPPEFQPGPCTGSGSSASSISMSTSENDTDTNSPSPPAERDRSMSNRADEMVPDVAVVEHSSVGKAQQTSAVDKDSPTSTCDIYSEVEEGQVLSSSPEKAADQNDEVAAEAFAKSPQPSDDVDMEDMEDIYSPESGEVQSDPAPSPSRGEQATEQIASVLRSPEPERSVLAINAFTSSNRSAATNQIHITDYDSVEEGEYEPPEETQLTSKDDAVDGTVDDHVGYEPPDAVSAKVSKNIDPPVPHIQESSQAAHVVQTAFTPELPRDPLADDLGSSLDPDTKLEDIGADLGDPLNADHRFTPYQSSLKLFKAYRYHPEFSNSIPGGFRSISYSHNIDPTKPLCEYETAGGMCNDATCEDQHFKSMAITDDKILIQLSSSNPGQTDTEKAEWTDGLKAVLNDLRLKETKDSAVVAAEIAAYRRRFLNDPSRVLDL